MFVLSMLNTDSLQSKCKQSKAEANTAQNNLQKEITSLRDTTRTLQFKLRDIEVANDDFERQARHTTSSLEDLESKYNVTLERSVLLEGEMKSGEQERESLRIENQRLRDELSDLKVEAEINQEKLRHAAVSAEQARSRKFTPTDSIARPQSSISQRSPSVTTASSPTAATPPTKSASSAASDTQTPPSPPTSDKSAPPVPSTSPKATKSRLSMTTTTTPRPGHYSSRTLRHSRGPSAPSINGFITPASRRTTINRSNDTNATPMPNSTSLTQIRGLIGKMEKLEQRVQSARSKLPAPSVTPPRASPRPGSALSQSSLAQSYIPATVTVRSGRRGRPSASTTAGPGADTTPSAVPRPASRLSTGMPPPTPTRDSRPPSRASLASRQSLSHLPSAAGGSSRPVSRQSMSDAPRAPSRQSISESPRAPSRQSTADAPRAPSRQSLSGAPRTPGPHYPTVAERTAASRPRSSVGGSYHTVHGGGHAHSASVGRIGAWGGAGVEDSPETDTLTPTPSRRSIAGGSAIPVPAAGRRESGLARRTSSGAGGGGTMGPPDRRRRLSEVGETF